MTDDDTTPRDFAGPEAHFIPHFERRIEAIEHRYEEIDRRVDGLVASRDSGRKILWLVIPALVGALATVLIFAAEKIAMSAERAGETAAEIRALQEQRRQDREDIKELRDRLLRLSAGDHGPPTSTDLPLPDVFSLLGPSAVVGGGVGGSSPHRLNEQAPQPCCGLSWHSALLEQMSPHTCGWISGDFPQVQDSVAIKTTKAILSIPEM